MAQWEGHDKNEFGMPVGCRFVPTDEELLRSYLFRWVHGLLVSSPLVEEKDVYGAEPWVLLGDRPEAYFFSTKVPLRPGSKRTKRTAGTGSWVLYSRETPVMSVGDGREGVIGYKRCLSYRYGGSKNSGWTMHEFQLPGDEFQNRILCRIKVNPNSTSTGRKKKRSSSPSSLMEDDEQQILQPGPLSAADGGLMRGSIEKKGRFEVEPTPVSWSYPDTLLDTEQQNFDAFPASYNAFSSLNGCEEYCNVSAGMGNAPGVDEHYQQQISSNPTDGSAALGGSNALLSEEDILLSGTQCTDELIPIYPQPTSLVDGCMIPVQPFDQPAAAEASMAIVPAADKPSSYDLLQKEELPIHNTENAGKSALLPAGIFEEFNAEDPMFHIEELKLAMHEAYRQQQLQEQRMKQDEEDPLLFFVLGNTKDW